MLGNLRVDGSRLWSTIEASARIGATQRGGLRRLALTSEDGAMRSLFRGWCDASRYSVSTDAIGNVFAFRSGDDPSAPVVLIGSHLDTQIKGGRYDGVLGVLAGLEVLRTLDDRGIRTRASVAIVNWTNEEGARFEPPLLGSAVMTGRMSVADARARRDAAGISVGEALDQLGEAGTFVLPAECIDSYFELHIEQGPRLYESGVEIGVVTGAFHVRGMVVAIAGQCAHVGPTPMKDRRNALVAAARLAAALDDIGFIFAGTGGKSTTMRIAVEPNLLGIIPDMANITCDLRHPEAAGAEEMFRLFRQEVQKVEEKTGCSISISETWTYGGLSFDAACVATVRNAARELGLTSCDMLTEAGHDAMHLATRVPSGMIFVACENGLSHNEAESCTAADAERGANVLLRAVLSRAL